MTGEEGARYDTRKQSLSNFLPFYTVTQKMEKEETNCKMPSFHRVQKTLSWKRKYANENQGPDISASKSPFPWNKCIYLHSCSCIFLFLFAFTYLYSFGYLYLWIVVMLYLGAVGIVNALLPFDCKLFHQTSRGDTIAILWYKYKYK